MTPFEEFLWSIHPSLVPATKRLYCVECKCGRMDVIEQEFEKGWHKINGEWKCLKCVIKEK